MYKERKGKALTKQKPETFKGKGNCKWRVLLEAEYDRHKRNNGRVRQRKHKKNKKIIIK